MQIEAVDDGNTHTASYTVTVYVEDVNDNPVCDPSFSTGPGKLMLAGTICLQPLVITIEKPQNIAHFERIMLKHTGVEGGNEQVKSVGWKSFHFWLNSAHHTHTHTLIKIKMN